MTIDTSPEAPASEWYSLSWVRPQLTPRTMARPAQVPAGGQAGAQA